MNSAGNNQRNLESFAGGHAPQPRPTPHFDAPAAAHSSFTNAPAGALPLTSAGQLALRPEGFAAPVAAPSISTSVMVAAGLALAIVFASAHVASVAFSPPTAADCVAYQIEPRSGMFSSVTSNGVCVMSRLTLSKLRGAGNSAAALEQLFHPERVQPAPSLAPPSKIFKVEDFTEPEQYALMQASERTRNQAIWHKLREGFEVRPFTVSTFAALRERGLAHRPEGRRFHMLTIEGERAATIIADHLQREHDIHQGYMGGRDGATVSMKCTCGWSCGLRAGDNMARKLMNAMGQHLRSQMMMKGLKTALAPGDTTAEGS